MTYFFFLNECRKSLKYLNLIIYLSLVDIKIRYSKTIIGPLWTSLSIGIFVVSFGIIGSKLWNQDIKDFMPFFSSGYITWILISNIISESTSTLSNSARTLKSINTPYLVFLISMVLKNLIIFFHHLLVYFLICLFLDYKINSYLLFIVPSVFIIFLIGIMFSFIWSILCTRYNDLSQFTSNLLQIFFFLTPVFWPADKLQGIYFKLLVELNPIYQILNLIRQPLLGNMIAIENLMYALLILLVLLICCLIIGNKVKKDIIFFI